MTTDVAEAPQAAEPAAQDTQGTDELAEAKEFLSSLEPSQAEGETVVETPDGTDQAPPETQDEDELAAIQARAERLAAEKLEQQEAEKRRQEEASREAEAETKRKQTRKQQYDEAAPTLRKFLEEQNLDAADVNAALNWFTSYNGLVDDALREELRTAYVHWAAQTLPEDVRPEFRGKEFTSTKEFFDTYKAHVIADARKGYVKESEQADLEATALLRLKSRFRKNPAALEAFVNSLSGPSLTGSGNSSTGASGMAGLESKLAREGNLSASEWSQYNRLRGEAGLTTG